MDVHSRSTRSYNMSQIKGKNTKPEILIRKFLHGRGFRFRIHYSKLPGKPDIVLPKYKVVIQVNGCFWHGHNECKYFILPKTRTDWWKDKIDRTIEKDAINNAELKNEGWRVLTIWECQLKKDKIEKTFSNIILFTKENIIN